MMTYFLDKSAERDVSKLEFINEDTTSKCPPKESHKMTVKDLIAELMNLPLDVEAEVIVVGPNPHLIAKGDLAQCLRFKGTMVEHSSKGDSRKCAVVLESAGKPLPLETYVEDFEDGTIRLPDYRRDEGDPIEEKPKLDPQTFEYKFKVGRNMESQRQIDLQELVKQMEQYRAHQQMFQYQQDFHHLQEQLRQQQEEQNKFYGIQGQIMSKEDFFK